jgi:hypothetical protein
MLLFIMPVKYRYGYIEREKFMYPIILMAL